MCYIVSSSVIFKICRNPSCTCYICVFKLWISYTNNDFFVPSFHFQVPYSVFSAIDISKIIISHIYCVHIGFRMEASCTETVYWQPLFILFTSKINLTPTQHNILYTYLMQIHLLFECGEDDFTSGRHSFSCAIAFLVRFSSGWLVVWRWYHKDCLLLLLSAISIHSPFPICEHWNQIMQFMNVPLHANIILNTSIAQLLFLNPKVSLPPKIHPLFCFYLVQSWTPSSFMHYKYAFNT